MIQLTDEVIAPQKVLDSLKTNASGSVVMHLAIVRKEGQLAAIEYQADRTEAEDELAEIARDMANKWEAQDIALVRRMGRVGVGETILVAAVASPHRKDAFEACAFAVERLRGMKSVKKREVKG